MSLSVGSNRVMSQRTTLKKPVENQEEPKKTETKQTAESPKVNVSAQQKAVQVSNSAFLANRGIEIVHTSKSGFNTVNEVIAIIEDNEQAEMILNGKVKIPPGSNVRIFTDKYNLAITVKDDGSVVIQDFNKSKNSPSLENSKFTGNFADL